MSQSFRVSKHDDGRRIDRIIRKIWPDLPLGAVMRAFRKGLVRLDGKRVECSFHALEGQLVDVPWEDEVAFRQAAPSARRGSGSSLIEIIYADRDICLVNKPSNLLSQPDTKGGESVIARVVLTIGWSDPYFTPTPAHRLDRNTSGAMVLALTGKGLRSLHEAWRTGRVKKTYLALVAGDASEEGEINTPIYKTGEGNISVTDGKQGQPALTRFRKLEGDGSLSLLLVELMTGRPHQARVHLASKGLPIIGDIKYGNRKKNEEWRKEGVGRPMLHSRAIEFHEMDEPLGHISGKKFLAVPPDDFMNVLARKGWRLYDRRV
jgi:23S rRNA pseudouridine955/2504/2580 synthase